MPTPLTRYTISTEGGAFLATAATRTEALTLLRCCFDLAPETPLSLRDRHARQGSIDTWVYRRTLDTDRHGTPVASYALLATARRP